MIDYQHAYKIVDHDHVYNATANFNEKRDRHDLLKSTGFHKCPVGVSIYDPLIDKTFCDNYEENTIPPLPNYNYLENHNHVNDSYKYCEHRVMQFKDYYIFYIGVSHDPNKRFKQHIKEFKNDLEDDLQMIVLSKLNTKSKAKKVENKLIKRFYNDSSNFNLAQHGGSGITEGPNYIYALIYQKQK